MSGKRKAPEGRELKIDRGLYVVQEVSKTYRYLRRNHKWRDLDPGENERNKRHLDGYTRIFPDGVRRSSGTVRPTQRRCGHRWNEVTVRLVVTAWDAPNNTFETESHGGRGRALGVSKVRFKAPHP